MMGIGISACVPCKAGYGEETRQHIKWQQGEDLFLTVQYPAYCTVNILNKGQTVWLSIVLFFSRCN